MRMRLLRGYSILKHLWWRLRLWSPLGGQRAAAPVDEVDEMQEAYNVVVQQPVMPKMVMAEPEPVHESVYHNVHQKHVPRDMHQHPYHSHADDAGKGLTGWKLVLLVIVVLAVSLGSFFF